MTLNNKGSALKKPQSPAEQGLEELIEMGSDGDSNTSGNNAAPAAALRPVSGRQATAESYDDDEMEQVGANGPRVSIFYTHDAYDGMDPNTNKVIQVGEKLSGTYEGSFTSGQYDSRKHKITLAGQGITVAPPSAGKLDRAFQFVPTGTKTEVTYEGRATKAEVGPDWKGQLPYRYSVALPKSINAAIKGGTYQPNYQLKDKSAGR